MVVARRLALIVTSAQVPAQVCHRADLHERVLDEQQTRVSCASWRCRLLPRIRSSSTKRPARYPHAEGTGAGFWPARTTTCGTPPIRACRLTTIPRKGKLGCPSSGSRYRDACGPRPEPKRSAPSAPTWPPPPSTAQAWPTPSPAPPALPLGHPKRRDHATGNLSSYVTLTTDNRVTLTRRMKFSSFEPPETFMPIIILQSTGRDRSV
jgi:hypothetical protein